MSISLSGNDLKYFEVLKLLCGYVSQYSQYSYLASLPKLLKHISMHFENRVEG